MLSPLNERSREEDGFDDTAIDAHPAVENVVYSCPVDHSGATLYVKGWRRPDSTFNPLILVHDLGENIGLYRQTALNLCDKGYSVYGFDLRGHGRSGRRFGHIPRFHQLVSDVLQVAAWIKFKERGRAPIVVGQGLGALVAILFQQAHPRYCRAVVLSAPSVVLSTPLSRSKELLIRVLAEFTPSLRLPPKLCPRFTSDTRAGDRERKVKRPGTYALIASEPRITATFANEILRAMGRAASSFTGLSCDTLMLCPTSDIVCDYRWLQRAAPSEPDHAVLRTLVDLDGVGHQVFVENPDSMTKALDVLVPWLASLQSRGLRAQRSISENIPDADTSETLKAEAVAPEAQAVETAGPRRSPIAP